MTNAERQYKVCFELQQQLRAAGAACPDCGVTRHLHSLKIRPELPEPEILWQCWKCAWVGQENRHAGFKDALEKEATMTMESTDRIYPAKSNAIKEREFLDENPGPHGPECFRGSDFE